MLGRILMLAALLAYGAFTYVTHHDEGVIRMLAVFSWGFTGYMALRVGYVCGNMVPRTTIYRPLKLTVPRRVNRDNIPQIERFETDNNRVFNMVTATFTKIEAGADTAAVNHFFAAQINLMRRMTMEKFSGAISEINVLGFEGIIGTLIGLIAFLAQAAQLFKFTATDDTVGLVQELMGNLNQIDLVTVSTAFLTSIIGWGSKAWIGLWIDQRKSEELESITDLEAWFLTDVISHLSEQEMLTDEKIDRLSETVNTAVDMIMAVFGGDKLNIRVQYVKGGMELSLGSDLDKEDTDAPHT